jgi:hypothetical protein
MAQSGQGGDDVYRKSLSEYENAKRRTKGGGRRVAGKAGDAGHTLSDIQ